MSQSQDKFVLPGDVIVTGTYTPEQNVVLDDDRVTATAVGFYEIEDNAVKVIPLTGYYTPNPDDLLLAKLHHTHHFHGKLTLILSVFLFSQHLIYLEKIILLLRMNFPQNKKQVTFL